MANPAPPSASGGSATRWLDVQPYLERVQKDMQLGELLHGENFSLFDAMSAIEIGDAKMDQCLVAQGGSTTLEELLRDNAPVTLTGPQLLSVLDRLLAAEAAWHNGATVVQSLFTCLYMHQVDRVSESMLPMSAYCNATLATSVLVRDVCLTGAAAEDEDFLPHTFGLELETPSSNNVAKVVGQLNLALDQLASLLKKAHGPAVSSWGVMRVEPHLIPALQARLRFRKALLQGLQRLKGLQSGKADLDAARKLLATAASELQAVRDTAQQMEQQEGGHGGLGGVGFDHKVNSVLAMPVPPRPFKLYSVPEAFDYYSSLLDDLCCFVCRLHAVSSWPHLKQFLSAFALRGASPLARSLMHSAINRAHKSSGRQPFQWSPSADMACASLCLPPHDKLPGEEIKAFVSQCAIGMENWAQVMCLNPARRHRRFKRLLEDWSNIYTHAINCDYIPEVQELMQRQGWQWQPLDLVGGDPQGPLASWVEREAALSAAQRLTSGFELQLYAPHELPMVYWYVDYLLSVAQMDEKAVYNASPKQQQQQQPGAKGGGGVGSAKHRSAAAQQKQQQQALVQASHMKELLLLEAQRMLSQGLMRGCVALRLAGKGKRFDPPPFNTEEQRFHQRFGLFAMMQRPEPLSCAYYLKSMDTAGVKASQLYQMAVDCLAKAHGALVLLQEQPQQAGDEQQQILAAHYKSMDRCCMANNVALRLMQRAALASEKKATTAPPPSSSSSSAPGNAGDGKAAAAVAEAAAGAAAGEGDGLDVAWDMDSCPHFPVLKIKTRAKPQAAAANGGA